MKVDKIKIIILYLMLMLTAIDFSPVYAASSTNSLEFNKIIFFGDSLSDNGNFYSTSFHIMPKSPPYYRGRFSNGPVWTDTAADYFKRNYNITSENFATGGEVTGLHFGLYSPWTLFASVGSHLLRSFYSDRSTTLYVIWISGNDYLNGAADVEDFTNRIINNISYNVEELISHGAKHFLLITEPDLSTTPYSKYYGTTENIAAITAMHNKKLYRLVGKLSKVYTDVHFELYDAYALFKDFLANPEKIENRYNVKIKNIQDPCWSGGYIFAATQAKADSELTSMLEKMYATEKNHYLSQYRSDASGNASAISLSPDVFAQTVMQTPALKVAAQAYASKTLGGKRCSNPDEYLFWDQIHPTSVVHGIIASELISEIENTFHS